MNCFPLIERELRLAVRRGNGGTRVRVLCGGGAMAAAFLILFVWSAWSPTPGFGRPFLQFLAGAGFLGAVVTGMMLTADSLSREKREGTLDLILLTDLRLRDVILGKLIAKTIVPLYGLLAMVPVLEMSVLIGGTTASECARLYLVWINALFYSMAASLLVSALCREQRAALFGAIFTLLILAAGIPFVGVAVSRATGSTTAAHLSLLVSPSGPWSYVWAKGWFWGALVVNQILAWSFLALAHRFVLRNRSEIAVSAPASRAANREERRVAHEKSRQLQLLDSEPLRWLMSRRSRQPWVLWACCAVAVVFLLVWEPSRIGGARAQMIGYTLLGIHLVFKLAIATNVTHLFVADKRSGALESLLATSVDVREMAAGVLREFRHRLGGPMFILELVTLLAAVRLFHAGLTQGALVMVVAAVLLPVDSYCVFWIGLFQGIAARSGAIALATTVFEILLLPWAWFGIGMQIFVRSSIYELLVLLAITLPVSHLWFFIQARTNLWRHFRTLALKPYGEKNPPLESDWSPINWDEEPSWQA